MDLNEFALLSAKLRYKIETSQAEKLDLKEIQQNSTKTALLKYDSQLAVSPTHDHGQHEQTENWSRMAVELERYGRENGELKTKLSLIHGKITERDICIEKLNETVHGLRTALEELKYERDKTLTETKTSERYLKNVFNECKIFQSSLDRQKHEMTLLTAEKEKVSQLHEKITCDMDLLQTSRGKLVAELDQVNLARTVLQDDLNKTRSNLQRQHAEISSFGITLDDKITRMKRLESANASLNDQIVHYEKEKSAFHQRIHDAESKARASQDLFRVSQQVIERYRLELNARPNSDGGKDSSVAVACSVNTMVTAAGTLPSASLGPSIVGITQLDQRPHGAAVALRPGHQDLPALDQSTPTYLHSENRFTSDVHIHPQTAMSDDVQLTKNKATESLPENAAMESCCTGAAAMFEGPESQLTTEVTNQQQHILMSNAEHSKACASFRSNTAVLATAPAVNSVEPKSVTVSSPPVDAPATVQSPAVLPGLVKFPLHFISTESSDPKPIPEAKRSKLDLPPEGLTHERKESDIPAQSSMSTSPPYMQTVGTQGVSNLQKSPRTGQQTSVRTSSQPQKLQPHKLPFAGGGADKKDKLGECPACSEEPFGLMIRCGGCGKEFHSSCSRKIMAAKVRACETGGEDGSSMQQIPRHLSASGPSASLSVIGTLWAGSGLHSVRYPKHFIRVR